MYTSLGLIAIVMWGSLALLSHETKSIPPFQLLFLCFSIATSTPLLLQLVRWAHQKKNLHQCLSDTISSFNNLTFTSCVVGIYGLFGFHLCYFLAMRYAPAVEVSLISYTWPVLLAIFMSRRTQRLAVFFGSLLGFSGIAFLLLGNDASINYEANTVNTSLLGYGFALLCAFIWSSYSYLLTKTQTSSGDTAWICLFVAMLSLVVHLMTESSNWQTILQHKLVILLLGVGPIGGAFYLWQQGLQRGNGLLLASLSYLAPVISAGLLVFAGINSWSPQILVALVFVLTGGIIVNFTKRHRN